MDITQKVIQAVDEAIKECFQSVMSVTLTEVENVQSQSDDQQVISSIGFGGQIEGNLSVIISDQAACQLVAKMLCMDFAEVNSDVLDGVGEIVNMTGGGTKNRLTVEYPLQISIPTTIRGKHIDVFAQKDLTRIFKRYKSDEITIDVLVYFKIHTDKPSIATVEKPGVKLTAAEKLAAIMNKNKVAV